MTDPRAFAAFCSIFLLLQKRDSLVGLTESAVAVLDVKADVQRLTGKRAATFVSKVKQDFQFSAGFLVLI